MTAPPFRPGPVADLRAAMAQLPPAPPQYQVRGDPVALAALRSLLPNAPQRPAWLGLSPMSTGTPLVFDSEVPFGHIDLVNVTEGVLVERIKILEYNPPADDPPTYMLPAYDPPRYDPPRTWGW